MSYFSKWLFAILAWWLAPIFLKKYLSWIDVFILCGFILFFAWIPILLVRNYFKAFSNKGFILNSFIVSILTIIHYSWNFYWIIYWNIIITTLIIKNSPFFQKFIYSILHKRRLGLLFYIIAWLLVLWVALTTYNTNTAWTWVKLMHILIPLVSAIAWAYLMIFISKIENKSETLWTGNIISSLLIGMILVYIWKVSFSTFASISSFQYLMLWFLWIIPTLVGPILWAQAINESKGAIIFFDYITPIITIILSIFIFDIQLNIFNYFGILLIVVSLIIYSLLFSEPKKSVP